MLDIVLDNVVNISLYGMVNSRTETLLVNLSSQVLLNHIYISYMKCRIPPCFWLLPGAQSASSHLWVQLTELTCFMWKVQNRDENRQLIIDY